MISVRPSLVFLFVWIIESLFLSSYTTDDVIDILRDDGKDMLFFIKKTPGITTLLPEAFFFCKHTGTIKPSQKTPNAPNTNKHTIFIVLHIMTQDSTFQVVDVSIWQDNYLRAVLRRIELVSRVDED